MATDPIRSEPPLDIREQLARIDQMHANIGQLLAGTDKTRQDTKFAPLSLVLTGLGAGAALFAAGAAFAKLIIG